MRKMKEIRVSGLGVSDGERQRNAVETWGRGGAVVGVSGASVLFLACGMGQ